MNVNKLELAVEPLIHALEDESWRARWRATNALGKIGDIKAVEPLIQAFSDCLTVAIRVALALAKIGKLAVESLIRAWEDDDWPIRGGAVIVLGRIGAEKQAEQEAIEKAAGKAFTSEKYKAVMEQESENAGKTLDQPKGGIDKIDETKTIAQPSGLPFDLSEKTGNDRILGDYYNSQWIIEKATNVTAASCPTLRDFLNKVIPRLPAETADHFFELIKITEVVMYSAAEQDERAVIRSCQLAEGITKQLCSNTTYYSR